MHNRIHWFFRLLVLVGLWVGACFYSDDLLLIGALLILPTIIINMATDAGGRGAVLYFLAHMALLLEALFISKVFTSPRGAFFMTVTAGAIVIWDMVFTMLPRRYKNGIVYDLGTLGLLILPFFLSSQLAETKFGEKLMFIFAIGAAVSWGVYLLFLATHGFFNRDEDDED